MKHDKQGRAIHNRLGERATAIIFPVSLSITISAIWHLNRLKKNNLLADLPTATKAAQEKASL